MRTFGEIKSALVVAHRSGNWEAAKRLSQEKEKLKRRTPSKCEDCGAPITRGAERCQFHNARYVARTRRRGFGFIPSKMLEVLRLKSAGHTSDHISSRLRMHRHTVANYLRIALNGQLSAQTVLGGVVGGIGIY